MEEKRDQAQHVPHEPIGFIGLGVMGQPMALNLARAGTPLVVWNRSSAATKALHIAGAQIAGSVAEVFERAKIVILMLVNEDVLDAVLARGSAGFSSLVAGKIVVSMGSNPPDYSRALARDIAAAGGRYVEAPVSGSRKPAEAAQLVVMLGGDAETVAEVRPILSPLCRESVVCGPVGSALLLKFAVNLYLNTMLVGLAEAVHFAGSHGLDLQTFKAAIDAGPMACDVTRVKIPMLAARDFSVQAATADAFQSTRLIADAARAIGIATPLLDQSRALYGESVELGNSRRDMVSVLEAIEARTRALQKASESVASVSVISTPEAQ
jgi:3-hydroxyisobutyrate dehydrogenase